MCEHRSAMGHLLPDVFLFVRFGFVWKDTCLKTSNRIIIINHATDGSEVVLRRTDASSRTELKLESPNLRLCG